MKKLVSIFLLCSALCLPLGAQNTFGFETEAENVQPQRKQTFREWMNETFKGPKKKEIQ